jgi:hypothetical protein
LTNPLFSEPELSQEKPCTSCIMASNFLDDPVPRADLNKIEGKHASPLVLIVLSVEGDECARLDFFLRWCKDLCGMARSARGLS